MSKQRISDYEIVNCELNFTDFKIGDQPQTSSFFQLTKNVADGNVQLSCSLKKFSSFTKLDVDIIKTCPKPAMATIKLQLREMKCHIRNVNNWEQKYQFNELPFEYDSQRCMNHGSCIRSHKDATSHTFSIDVKCQIIWYGFIDEFYSPNSGRVFTPYSYEMDFCDMKIKVGEKYYLVHKMMVGSRSTVMKKTLMANMKESQENCIDFTDLGADVVEELLLFIYENRIDKAENDEDLLLELSKVGDMYDFPELKNYCEMLLSNKLTEENVLMLLRNAHIHKLSLLRIRAIAFILVEKEEILSKEEFKELGMCQSQLLFEIFNFSKILTQNL